VDALSPVVLRDRVREAIEAYIDEEAWQRCARIERTEQESMRTFAGNWRQGVG
jgi:hypothetical protein